MKTLTIISIALILLFAQMLPNNTLQEKHVVKHVKIESNDKTLYGLSNSSKAKTLRFIESARKAGYRIIITSAYRTAHQQQNCYNQGRITAGNIITNAKGYEYESLHQWGKAIDVIYIKKNKKYPPNQQLGKIGEACGFVWLGRCKTLGFNDPYHFQNN